MREILFRGKRTDNGEWVEGYIECFNCQWCGKTKLGLNRAIKSWNKESENKWKND